MIDLQQIDESWTLFLVRDGVINYEKQDDYVLTWEEFIFMDGVKEAIQKLSTLFSTMVIMTNQRCIGKGLLSVEGLQTIHAGMLGEIASAGGRIDKIYFCPDLEDNAPNRKPNPGMAFQAKRDFPQIDFSKTIMVGNKLSDMAFGRNAGVHTVFLATTHPGTPFPHPYINLRFPSLPGFAQVLRKS